MLKGKSQCQLLFSREHLHEEGYVLGILKLGAQQTHYKIAPILCRVTN